MAKVLIENSAFDKLLFGQGSIRIHIYLRKNVPATDKKFHSLIITREVLILTLPIFRMGFLIHPKGWINYERMTVYCLESRCIEYVHSYYHQGKF